jgi:SecD/SecF fusion protein
MSAHAAPRCLVAGLIAGALALAGCGGDDVASRPSCAKPKADFGTPTTRLTFRVPDATPAQVGQARRIVCARLAGMGVEHRVTRSAADRLIVELPRGSELASPAAGASVFGAGRLAIYDWEVNVLGPGGVPAPHDGLVTGGVDAGHGGALTLYDAVRRAARRPLAIGAGNARASSVFYAVDPQARQVVTGSANLLRQPGAPTPAAARAAVPATARDRMRIVEVKPGTIVVRAEQAPDVEPSRARWYVLRDAVALRGTGIENLRPDRDPQTGEPVVTFEFSAEGRRIWPRLTRAIADRGRSYARGLPGESANEANQHFAIVVDDAIVSVPYIDFRRNPDGIGADNGSQVGGGFTTASARQLAVLLADGPLPAPLELVASSRTP